MTDPLLAPEAPSHSAARPDSLQAALHEHRLMFDNAAVGILFVRDHVVQRCNRRFAEIFGYAAPEDLAGRPTRLFYPGEDGYRRHSLGAYEEIRTGRVHASEVEVRHREGHTFWVQATGRRIGTPDPEDKLSVIWIIQDVTERHEAEAALTRYRDELEQRVRERTAELAQINARLEAEIEERRQAEQRVWHVANHDVLTGLPNRSLFQDRLNQALAMTARHFEKAALLFVDLDRFKSINDTLGHEVGDELLKEVARRLRGCLRGEDTVARLGGDEFVIILPNIRCGETAALVAEKLRTALAPQIPVAGRPLHVSASIGIALYPDNGFDATTLMRNADIAMYHAKAGGRDAIQFFDHSMSQAASHFFQIESKLAEAIAGNELSLRFQPLVDIAAGHIVGVEALLRWKTAEGFVPPSEFIPVAEETGQIIAIGEWVLRHACAQAAAWQRGRREAGLAPLTVAVNLSPRQFRQPGLVPVIRAILDETGLPPACLELEITESALMDHLEDTRTKLEELSGIGVRLAIDDFGTGYSSLNYLKRFPVDKLKVDQSFVRDLCCDADDAAIVSAIVSLARNLGMDALAEGVETTEQLEMLKRTGCALCQGYLFAPPLTIPALDAVFALPAEAQLKALPKATLASG